MPLTVFQKKILNILSGTRSEASHFAGGIVLHGKENSSRYSRDFDIFHDVVSEVTRASETDFQRLKQQGIQIVKVSPHGEWEKPASFRKASITHEGETLEIDWAADSAFRFFPVEKDEIFGWRLHQFDIATNKALALASRTETRDYLDIIQLQNDFPLSSICWAACGKDPGFTPVSLLQMMRRFAKIDPLELDLISARKLDPRILKDTWITMSDQALEQMESLADQQPEIEIGVAFVDKSGKPGWIGEDPSLCIHHPSLMGCWPMLK
jgi:hypothetical protein